MGSSPPTNTDLYVVSIGRVLQVVYGAHHVQGHVTDVMSVILCLLWSPGDHHVGVSNGFNLEGSNCCATSLFFSYRPHEQAGDPS